MGHFLGILLRKCGQKTENQTAAITHFRQSQKPRLTPFRNLTLKGSIFGPEYPYWAQIKQNYLQISKM